MIFPALTLCTFCSKCPHCCCTYSHNCSYHNFKY
nr:MAG TPA: hypothetical protein [Microviridae sp.]